MKQAEEEDEETECVTHGEKTKQVLGLLRRFSFRSMNGRKERFSDASIGRQISIEKERKLVLLDNDCCRESVVVS